MLLCCVYRLGEESVSFLKGISGKVYILELSIAKEMVGAKRLGVTNVPLSVLIVLTPKFNANDNKWKRSEAAAAPDFFSLDVAAGDHFSLSVLYSHTRSRGAGPKTPTAEDERRLESRLVHGNVKFMSHMIQFHIILVI
uniref:Uncharacterized protein n=1 Tax=Cannabis sativa TaxID=3483 RepID=A0A803NNY6_CANSA